MKKIMVVDDESVVSSLIIRHLRCAYPEAVIDAFANGRQAWDVISVSGHDYCLLVTDLHMPEMDGLALSSKVSEAFPEIKIVMLSGRPDLAIGAKVHAILAKPISFDDLLENIRTQIGG